MADEEKPWGNVDPGLVPPLLFGAALVFSLLGLTVGWFTTNTVAEIWEYDASHPEGKGDKCILLQGGEPLCSVRIETWMTPTQLGSKVTPSRLHDFLETSNELPTYDEDMALTGTAMLGVLMLHLVALVALVGAIGFYAWTRRSRRRTFGPTVWRFAGLFGAFAFLALVYLALRVPPAAEGDTHDLLGEYQIYLESQGFPNMDPALLQPDVGFWNTWTCCPPESHFPRGGNEYLIVVTTESRPGAGFWLEAANLVFTTGALALATNSGQFDPKTRPAGAGAPPAPAKPQ